MANSRAYVPKNILAGSGEPLEIDKILSDLETNLVRYESRPLDFSRGSVSPSVIDAVEGVYEILQKAGGLNGYNSSRIKSHLNMLLCNLIHLHFALPGIWIRYACTPNRYKLIERYHPFGCSYRHAMEAIEALKNIPFVEFKRGYFDRDMQIGKQSIIRANLDLVDFLTESFGVRPEDVAEKYQPELIQLRSNEKLLLPYEETDSIVEMRSELHAYNALIDNHNIELQLTGPDRRKLLRRYPVDFSRNHYHRIFNNGSFELGGRFYGPWWQGVKSELRRFINIDNLPSVGIDYSAIHIHLLYSREGLSYADTFGTMDDPYSLTAGPALHRDILKLVMLIAVNAKNKKSALSAIRLKLRESDIYIASDILNEFISLFAEKHNRISSYFFSGIGLELQRLESRVSEQVIRESVSRDIPVLNIHDCFVSQTRHEEFLREQMNTAFAALNLRSIPNLKKEF